MSLVAEPCATLGAIATAELRLDTGRALIARAVTVAPSCATGFQWQAETLMTDGEFDQALASAARAIALCPHGQRGTA